MEKSYKEIYEILNEEDICVIDAYIASEVYCCFNSEKIVLDDESFEYVCSYINNLYLKYEDVSIEGLVKCFKKEFQYKSLDEILKLPRFEFMQNYEY